MKVMLVDDSATMRRIQKTQLNKLGIADICEAGDGQEAWNALEGGMPPDLILLDWNMPAMDGFTLLKKIRQTPAYKDVKVIMCTSESEKGRVLEALKAGANNYLIKPFSPELLKEKLGL